MAKTLIEELAEAINALNLKYNSKKIHLQSVTILDNAIPKSYSQDVEYGIVYAGSVNTNDCFNDPSKFQTMLFELVCRTSAELNVNDNERILNMALRKVLNISTDTILEIYQVGNLNDYGVDEKNRNVSSYTIAVSTVDYLKRF